MIDLLKRNAIIPVVAIGIFVSLTIFLWPLFFLRLPLIYKICLILIHIPFLIYLDFYLFIHRKLFEPVRMLIMPLVIYVAKAEAIKEETDTWYTSADDIPCTNDSKEFLSSLSKKVRRDLKKKLKIFNERNLRVTTEHSDWLSLNKDMPVLIDHERRVVQEVGEGIFIEEFIKRFLVVCEKVMHIYEPLLIQSNCLVFDKRYFLGLMAT